MNIQVKFQLRYVEIDATGNLNYYKDASERSGGPTPNKQIRIANCTVEQAAGGSKNRFPFEITDADQNCITFAAETTEDAKAWIEMIRHASRYHARSTTGGGEEDALDPSDLQGTRKLLQQRMDAAKKKANIAAETVARLAMTMHMQAELLRNGLDSYDFTYESATVMNFKNDIESKVQVRGALRIWSSEPLCRGTRASCLFYSCIFLKPSFF